MGEFATHAQWDSFKQLVYLYATWNFVILFMTLEETDRSVNVIDFFDEASIPDEI